MLDQRSLCMRFLALASVLPACAGSAAPGPQTAASPASAPAAPAAEPAPTKPARQGAEDESWAGEKDAKGGAASAELAPYRNSGAPADATAGGKTETRTMDVIRKIVADHRKPVRECYQKARQELKDLQGDLVIHFVLDPRGKIKAIEVNQERSTLKSSAVGDCAISVLKGIEFPPSSRGMDTSVNYPYNFKP
jgi:hypothetical protein